MPQTNYDLVKLKPNHLINCVTNEYIINISIIHLHILAREKVLFKIYDDYENTNIRIKVYTCCFFSLSFYSIAFKLYL